MPRSTRRSTSPGHEAALGSAGHPGSQRHSRYLAANSSPATAERVRQHLRTRTSRLRGHPLMGRRSDNPEIRILAPTRYPYRIYYSVQGDLVAILHIRHTSRRTPDDLGL